DGLMLGMPSPPTHSPSMRFLCRSSMSVVLYGLEQPGTRQVAHQVARAVGPGRTLARKTHAIGKRAQRGGRDRDDVVGLVRETLAGPAAVLHRREHRAEVDHEAIRVLMMRPDGGGD